MKKEYTFKTSKGKPFPFGAKVQDKRINFALSSKKATAVTLCLFDRKSNNLIAEIPLSPQKNKTGYVWHIEVEGIEENVVYAYLIEPKLNSKQNILLDPYANAIAISNTWGQNCTFDNVLKKTYLPYGEILPEIPFDWGDDVHPFIPLQDLIIYEMHVRAFTQDTSSHVEHPGTFLGLIEKIPHLLELGINALELMPVHEFNEMEYAKTHPDATRLLCNFWGYSTVNYFTPMNRYATSEAAGTAIKEFKTMVKALHQHGIEVILDVVYNHTAEGNEDGPVISFKGIDNAIYYMVDNHNYRNYTGCGNTVNTNHAVVEELIIHSLRYWVSEMHVDGFRFDLASIFSRDSKGMPLTLAPIIKAITEDPILASTKLIAEPWDAAGLYQVGNFACKSLHWLEWNDKYRDMVRRFLKGMPGANGDFARRLSGSEDLYHDRSPTNSINFITAHDGFTLADLVSYNVKHNLENGEHNQDGNSHNESWNCGVEGETDDKEVLKIRQRQMRNFHLTLMLSQGVPMVLMGDEYGHTKKGNNNTWCHDSPLNWFLWNQLDTNQDFYRFYSGLIHFRKTHPILRRTTFLTDEDIDWHGIVPLMVDWKGEIPFLAFTLKDHEASNDLYAAFNASHEELTITLPAPPAWKKWFWVVNTSNPSPQDFYDDNSGSMMEDSTYTMLPYSSLLLEAHTT